MELKVAPNIPRWVPKAIEAKAKKMGLQGKFEVVLQKEEDESWAVSYYRSKFLVPKNLGGFPFYFNSCGAAGSICHEIAHLKNRDGNLFSEFFFLFKNWPFGLPFSCVSGKLFRIAFLHLYQQYFPEGYAKNANALKYGFNSWEYFLVFCDFLFIFTFTCYPPYCRFSRSKEIRADAESLQYLSTKEKVDLLIFFLKFAVEKEKFYKKDGWKYKNLYETTFASHPSDEDRIKRIEEHLKQQFFLIRLYAFLLLYLSPTYWINRGHLMMLKYQTNANPQEPFVILKISSFIWNFVSHLRMPWGRD